MCTIGAVKNHSDNSRVFFKNVDQTHRCVYPDAFVTKGDTFHYLKMASNADTSKKGVLAGVNEAGVVVLGADGNAQPNYTGAKYGSLNESLVVYESILSQCGSVREALDLVINEYQNRLMGGNGDIVIVGDRNDTVALEYLPNRWGIEFQGDNPYLIRSNFFVLMDRLRPPHEENTLHTSSAIRYADTLKHLSIKGRANTLDDVFNLVTSHYQGKNAMSICRHGGDGEYFTHASFIAELRDNAIEAHVMLNCNPCEGTFQTFSF
jgi:hypothetical protein